MITILRLIEKLEELEKPSDRKQLIKYEFSVNPNLRYYLDMIYGEHKPSIINKLPKVEKDSDIAGLQYSSLERSKSMIETVLFNEKIDVKRRNILVEQLIENIHSKEVQIVEAIMKNKWKYCTIKFYQEELLNANI